jgi:hypothetical protein
MRRYRCLSISVVIRPGVSRCSFAFPNSNSMIKFVLIIVAGMSHSRS